MDWKNFLKRLYPLALILLVYLVWKVRQSNDTPLSLVELKGTTMGNIGYSIKYYSENGHDYGTEIDSLLKVWNQSLSTYIPTSEISRFNSNDGCFEFESPYFYPVLEASRIVYDKSGGAFDPTVGPLVNAWGFGPDKSMAPDSSRVDSLMNFIGYDKIQIENDQVCKKLHGVKLDFSAVAKGYAVDVVADYLASKGIEDLLVEIGGELLCRGTKADNQPWRTAIEDPGVEVYERKYLAIVEMENRAVATSGNYRNYYVRDGIRYVHTINPSTGYPIEHKLLSASVFADNCMFADAYATAFMVLGVEKSISILEENPSIDAFLVFSGEDGELETFVTDGIAAKIELTKSEN